MDAVKRRHLMDGWPLSGRWIPNNIKKRLLLTLKFTQTSFIFLQFLWLNYVRAWSNFWLKIIWIRQKLNRRRYYYNQHFAISSCTGGTVLLYKNRHSMKSCSVCASACPDAPMLKKQPMLWGNTGEAHMSAYTHTAYAFSLTRKAGYTFSF